MGQTTVEKVLLSRTGRDRLAPGDRVDLQPDRFLCYGRTLPAVLDAIEGVEGGGIGDPSRVVVALDQFAGGDPSAAAAESACRARAAKLGVREFYWPGRGGVAPVVFLDAGYVKPGGTVAASDRHVFSAGAAGAMAIVPGAAGGSGTRCDAVAMADALRTGTLGLTVPATVRVGLAGKTARWVGGTDVGLHLLSKLDEEDVAGRAIEIGGEVTAAFGMTDRLDLAAALSAGGASQVFIDCDETTRVRMSACCDNGFTPALPDDDACYERRVEIDCGSVQPQVRRLSGRSVSVYDVREEPIDRVVIGGCSGGRLDDLRTVAHFLRDYMVRRSITLIVVPATQRILLHAMEEGLTQIILRAGGQIGIPSCRFAREAIVTGLAAGERCMVTGLCPAPDGIDLSEPCGARESGDDPDEGGGPHAGDEPNAGDGKRGLVAAANPAIATVAAIMGRIQTPLDLAKKVNRMATGMTR